MHGSTRPKVKLWVPCDFTLCVPLIVAALYSHRCMYVSTVSAEESSNCEGIGCQLSTGALAAIIIGAAVFLILLCLAIGCLVRQKLKKSKRSM